MATPLQRWPEWPQTGTTYYEMGAALFQHALALWHAIERGSQLTIIFYANILEGVKKTGGECILNLEAGGVIQFNSRPARASITRTG